jgi:hypothetical protein
MSASWRPAHVPLCVHSPVQQPLHGAFRDRRRNRLVLEPRRGVIDDDIAGIGGDAFALVWNGQRVDVPERPWRTPQRWTPRYLNAGGDIGDVMGWIA